MRALMPKVFVPCLTIVDGTEDGYAEVVLDVNGHVIASRVFFPDSQDLMYEWIREELLRRA